MTDLQAQGAQAIILGCTEIAMLVQTQHTALPLFDTTALHARSAALWALS
jgi:aspartate racemase